MSARRAIRRLLLAGTVLAMVAAVIPSAAQATFRGANGKIAFQTNQGGPASGYADIYAVNPDGTDLRNLTPTTASEAFPAWSPDGKLIVFHDSGPRSVELYLIDADGGGRRALTSNTSFDYDASWSPDGSRIVFLRCGSVCQVATMNIYGGDVRGLTPFVAGGGIEPWSEYSPDWSPDGSLIAFASTRDGNAEIYTMAAADGSNPVNLTHSPVRELNPSWSPDGSQIAFERGRPGEGIGRQIYIMNADGSNVTALTDGPEENYEPVWSPDGTMIAFVRSADIWVMNADGSSLRPVAPPLSSEQTPDWQIRPTLLGHVRPKGATPLRVALVPAYQECVSPNHYHGPPLDHPSCALPRISSENLAIGTPDVNGAAPRFAGFALLTAVPEGSPSGEADMTIAMRLEDVRCGPSSPACAGANSRGGDDYVGQVALELAARLTDKASGPGADEEATVQDFVLEPAASCAQSADVTVGATCELVTSANAVVPGSVRQGARAVWQLDQVRVIDGGPDGQASTEPNSAFAVQGVFVP